MTEEEENKERGGNKPIIPEDDPLVRPGKGIAPKKDDLEKMSGMNEDVDTDPEKAVKQMEEIENSFGDVEKDIKERTDRVNKAVSDGSDEDFEDYEDGPPQGMEEIEEIKSSDDIEKQDSVKEQNNEGVAEEQETQPKKELLQQKMGENKTIENNKNENQEKETNTKLDSEKEKSVEKIHEEQEQKEAPEKKLVAPTVEQLKAAKNMDSETKQKMKKILDEMREKMGEIDRLTKELKETKNELSKTTPEKTEKLLEEIDVPPLEILK